MDIKHIARNILPFGSAVKSTDESKSAYAKTNADNDREGNGQASGEEQRHRKLSQEEIEDAVKQLEALPGIKDHNLRVRLEQVDGTAVIYVEDAFGKLVRRIPESEISLLTSNPQKKSGHLLNKAL